MPAAGVVPSWCRLRRWRHGQQDQHTGQIGRPYRSRSPAECFEPAKRSDLPRSATLWPGLGAVCVRYCRYGRLTQAQMHHCVHVIDKLPMTVTVKIGGVQMQEEAIDLLR